MHNGIEAEDIGGMPFIGSNMIVTSFPTVSLLFKSKNVKSKNKSGYHRTSPTANNIYYNFCQ